MIIPYGTDAPIYWWPFATVVLMVITSFAFVLQMVTPVTDWQHLILTYGDGLHPLQWLTSNFMHGDILHLLGNLVFLFTFGLIVEGKVGPLWFVLIYLGIGLLQCFVEQLLFLSMDLPEGGGSLGASAIVYGLMMVSLVWAPQDHIKMIFNPYLFYVYFIDVPVLMLGLIYVLWDFTVAFFSGFGISSSLLHLLGASVGLAIGVAFIALSRVDCEQRDLLSMFLELVGKKPIEKKMTAAEVRAEEDARKQRRQERKEQLEVCRRSMNAHLKAGNPKAAIYTFRQIRKIDRKAQWPEATLLKVIAEFQKAQDWDSVLEYSRLYLEAFQQKSVQVQLNMAKVLLLEKESPRKTLQCLAGVGEGADLSDVQRRAVVKLKKRARQMIEDGTIELD